MSTSPSLDGDPERAEILSPTTATETIAGLMAAAALFTSTIAVVYRPVRVAPVAILIALIAALMGGRHARLAAAAVVVGAICFALGMTFAVLTQSPLY